MLMTDNACNEDRFGEIALNLNVVSREKLDRGLLIQKMIFARTKVHMAIGKVLKEMGAITQPQIDTVLETQKYLYHQEPDDGPGPKPKPAPAAPGGLTGLKLIVSEDKLSAHLCPTGVQPSGLSLESVKDFLALQGVQFGLVEDQCLTDYLSQIPLPGEPFKVAAGIAPVEGRAAEVIYHFDTDPLRIGTLKSDGSMDWKNRGDIPQVNSGDLLVEKTLGEPGLPGTNIYGQELPAARIRDPKIKGGKGTQRSEDGRQILAKADGMPKLSSDGKVYVFGMLSIDGDIGVETGNIEFEGFIETEGTVSAGYAVKAKGLRTAGIQDAVIEVAEDLICHGGIYGSTIKAGGSIKASHIHNCTIIVSGDLVVEKEMFDCIIETNARCLINEGKILASTIDAKKGIEAFEIGSPASKPCRLAVGFDRQYERDLQTYEVELAELENQKIDLQASLPEYETQRQSIERRIADLAKEQRQYLAQKQQFEEQLNGQGSNPAEDDEERFMLQELIAELVQKNDEIEAKSAALSGEEEKFRLKIASVEKSFLILDGHIATCREKIEVLEESVKVDPGLPVIKVGGTIFGKTQIIAPHKEMTLEEDMHKVRIAENKEDPNSNKHQIKISNLR
jgi:uncharacterized protein